MQYDRLGPDRASVIWNRGVLNLEVKQVHISMADHLGPSMGVLNSEGHNREVSLYPIVMIFCGRKFAALL